MISICSVQEVDYLLGLAAEKNLLEVVKALVIKGCDVDSRC